MNSVINAIFTTLLLVLGSGYAAEKIYVAVRAVTLERIHKGMPPLSDFTHRLTCSKISSSGTLVPAECEKSRRAKKRRD